jgi:hypothetical protein
MTPGAKWQVSQIADFLQGIPVWPRLSSQGLLLIGLSIGDKV